jgi:superfamily I DNA/RNA helicase
VIAIGVSGGADVVMSKVSKNPSLPSGEAQLPSLPHVDALVLLPSYVKSLEQLTRRQPSLTAQVFRVLQRFLWDMRLLERSPLQSSRRNVYHTRIDDEKRLIDEPLETEGERAVALLHVGHHDAAIRWACAYDGDTAQAARRAAEELRRDALLPDSAALEGTSVMDSDTKPWQYTPGQYGELLKDEDLERHRVDPSFWNTVRCTADATPLEDLGLPAEVASALESTYINRLPSAPLIVPPPAVDEPAPLRITADQLPALLRTPLRRLLTRLTSEQRRLATRTSDGLLIVKGAAGTGKTVIGVRRLEHWLRQLDLFEERKLLYTCYNISLAGAVRQMINDTLPPHDAERIEVVNVNKLLARWIKERERKETRHEYRALMDLVPILAEARAHIGQPNSLRSWTDLDVLTEITEIIYGRAIPNLKVYLEIERTGRGRALAASARRDLWEVYRAFRHLCMKRNVEPWDNQAAHAIERLTAKPPSAPLYAGVVIDEVQDLSPAVLRAVLAAQCGDESRLVVLGDAAQNVYRNTFRWKDTGLRVTGGNSVILRRAHRSTGAIIAAAAPLVSSETDLDPSDLVLPEGANDADAPLPVVRRFNTRRAEIEGMATAIAAIVEDGVQPSSVGVLTDDDELRRAIRSLLHDLGCPVEDYLKPGQAKGIDISAPSVKLLSLGSAKGLEFSALFILGVTELAFPSDPSDPDAASRARRNLYTAMMRSAWSVVLSADRANASGLLDVLGPCHREDG